MESYENVYYYIKHFYLAHLDRSVRQNDIAFITIFSSSIPIS